MKSRAELLGSITNRTLCFQPPYMDALWFRLQLQECVVLFLKESWLIWYDYQDGLSNEHFNIFFSFYCLLSEPMPHSLHVVKALFWGQESWFSHWLLSNVRCRNLQKSLLIIHFPQSWRRNRLSLVHFHTSELKLNWMLGY